MLLSRRLAEDIDRVLQKAQELPDYEALLGVGSTTLARGAVGPLSQPSAYSAAQESITDRRLGFDVPRVVGVIAKLPA